MNLNKNPILKARITVMENLGELKTAKWYLARKSKDEFSIKTESEIKATGQFSIGEILTEIDGKTKDLPNNNNKE